MLFGNPALLKAIRILMGSAVGQRQAAMDQSLAQLKIHLENALLPKDER